jgi:hypothetical protein
LFDGHNPIEIAGLERLDLDATIQD